MRSDLLSVIIPIYNMDKYLERSIQSVLKQTYYNLEIILVNDGSTDRSLEICEKYSKQDDRIRIICQNNQGASAARRKGVRSASGQYITFLDPDDYIDVDFYENMMKCRKDFDIIISQWWRESGNHTRRARDTFTPGAYDTVEDMEFLLRHLINISRPGGKINLQPGIAAYQWNKLFKADLIKRVFEEVTIDLPLLEDRPIVYTAMLWSKSVLITEVCGYHYCVRPDSLIHSLDQSCGYIKVLCDYYTCMADIFSKDFRRDILMPQLQLKMAEDLTRAPNKMGFDPNIQMQIKEPIFPYLNQLDGTQIALYGAGFVGRSYFRQIQKWKLCEITLWVDENWEENAKIGLPVEPIERLLDTNYNYVILAIDNQELAERIRRTLNIMGITDSNILWKVPFIN